MEIIIAIIIIAVVAFIVTGKKGKKNTNESVTVSTEIVASDSDNKSLTQQKETGIEQTIKIISMAILILGIIGALVLLFNAPLTIVSIVSIVMGVAFCVLQWAVCTCIANISLKLKDKQSEL